jgi:hypothetical protein
MAISPIAGDGAIVLEAPTLTYRLNFETGDIEPVLIDDEEAIKQTVFKRLNTARNRYSIYSSDYGSDIEEIIYEDLPYDYLTKALQDEITTCLLIDERIKDVTNFVFDKTNDELNVQFTVSTYTGITVTGGVTI